uniref:Recep_L_domain domain-containing protein n=1 Tax=Caenorhabditis tropicalis TaxID=1561998 RepID=A0A1I7UAB2_9PELO
MFVLILFSIFYISFGQETCEENCHFNGSLVTLKTIGWFPKDCEMVCGKLIFNSETDVTEKELNETFINIRFLMGSLTIDNTLFKTLNWLSSLVYLTIDTGSISIRFNSLLTDGSVLLNWFPDSPTIYNIQHNPRLNLSSICSAVTQSFNIDLNIYGNLRNCGCKSIRIDPESIDYLPNCTRFIGGNYGTGLKITGIDESADLSSLSSVKSIEGSLEVYSTFLQNISFLKNLKLFEREPDAFFYQLDIHDNPNMKKLGLGTLKVMFFLKIF